VKPLTPLQLIQTAISHGAAIDVIERLAALQEKALDRHAEIQFNEAMNLAQTEIVRVAPDLTNPQTHSRYASYAALDKALRPVYTKHGFSLSFDTGDTPQPEMVRVLCYVSRRGHTRTYKVDMPSDGKGAKGGDVMTKTHATSAAMSYGMRYLLKYIFNVAIGEDDADGNSPTGLPVLEIREYCQRLLAAPNMDELKKLFRDFYTKAEKAQDRNAMAVCIRAKDQRKAELR
jgi:hypothetical protein